MSMMSDSPANKRRIYLDNAATSFPKPLQVSQAMADYAATLGASPGRGAYAEARESAKILADCRQQLANLFGSPSPDHVIFTLNTTDALNLAIRGIITHAQQERATSGQPVHVVTTDMDHNSVLRPLRALADRAANDRSPVTFTRVKAEPGTGLVHPADVAAAITPDTVLVAAVHASNATGTLQDIAAIGQICKQAHAGAGVPLLVDAAQTAGHLPINMDDMGIDLLALPGHKGLLGPLGTGALIIREGLENILATSREGGTGSVSEQDTHPQDLPDKYEAGSHNTVGIAGLLAGVNYLSQHTIEAVWSHEKALSERFLNVITDDQGQLPQGLRLLGPAPTTGTQYRVGVFSFTFDGLPPAEAADMLEQQFSVLTRPGLHCAPGAHETMGTDPHTAGAAHAGAVRFSLGHFLNEEDIDQAAQALLDVASRAAEKNALPA